VPDTGDHEARGDDRRHLRAEAEAASGRDPARGSSGEERAGEGSGERNAAEVREGGALRALAALERRAVLALAEVGAEGASLGAAPYQETGENRVSSVSAESSNGIQSDGTAERRNGAACSS